MLGRVVYSEWDARSRRPSTDGVERSKGWRADVTCSRLEGGWIRPDAHIRLTKSRVIGFPLTDNTAAFIAFLHGPNRTWLFG